MSKNIGWSKRFARATAKNLMSEDGVDAYAQEEQHWPRYPNAKTTYQWIVILQKKPNLVKKVKEEV